MYALCSGIFSLVLFEFTGPDFDNLVAEERAKLEQEFRESQAEEAAKIANRPRPEVVDALVKRAKAEIESAAPASPPKNPALNPSRSVTEISGDTMERLNSSPSPATASSPADLPKFDPDIREMHAEWHEVFKGSFRAETRPVAWLLRTIEEGRAWLTRAQLPEYAGVLKGREEQIDFIGSLTEQMEKIYAQRTGKPAWQHSPPNRPPTRSERRAPKKARTKGAVEAQAKAAGRLSPGELRAALTRRAQARDERTDRRARSGGSGGLAAEADAGRKKGGSVA